MLRTFASIFCLIFLQTFCRGDDFRCIKPWTRHRTRCLKIGTELKSWINSRKTCTKLSRLNSSLVEIFDEETNLAVKELLLDEQFDYWLGIKNGPRHQRYGFFRNDGPYWVGSNELANYTAFGQFVPNRGYEVECGYIDIKGKWHLAKDCTLKKRFVCSRLLDCEIGWYGANCDKVCNCYQTPCNRTSGVCPLACKRGWHGKVCDIAKLPAKASVHCFNKHNGDREALIRVDPLGVNYDDIYIINEQDNTPCCNISYFTKEDNGVLRLKLDLKEDGSRVPNCHTNPLKKNAFKWNLRTEEFKGFNNYYDREYQLTCDFDHADNLKREENLLITGDSTLKKVLVPQAKEKVQLIVQDPVTKQEIKSIEIGQNIELALHLEKQTETVMAKGISPHNCSVSSSDHQISRYLTDMDGCPYKNSPISSISVVNSTVESNIFEAFTLNGKTDLMFTCDFTYCYQPGDDDCVHICKKSRSNTRSKRSVRMMKDGTASAHLNVSHEGSSVFGSIIIGLIGTIFVVMVTVGSYIGYTKWKHNRK